MFLPSNLKGGIFPTSCIEESGGACSGGSHQSLSVTQNTFQLQVVKWFTDVIQFYTNVAIPITESMIEEHSQPHKICTMHFILLFEAAIQDNLSVMSLVQVQDIVLLFRISPLFLNVEIPG